MSKKAQVGGSHYQTAIQPIDYINANDMGYCEGNVVKYVSRHDKKNGKQDIEKAVHYALFILRDHYGTLSDADINKIMAIL